jgi:hypothetical protein
LSEKPKQLGKNIQDRKTREDSQDKTARTKKRAHDGRNMTARRGELTKGQPGQDKFGRTAMTGKSG